LFEKDVLGSYTTVLPKVFLDANMKDWVDYLGKLGEPPERSVDASWRPPVGQSRRVEFTNAIRLGRVGIDAELRCYATSIISVVEKQSTGSSDSKPLQPQPLALLQSSLEQQQLLLLALIKYREIMNARIPTAAISRTLQAVATFGLVTPGTASAATQDSVIADPSHLVEGTETFSSIIGNLAEQQQVASAVNFPVVAGEWNPKAGRRFFELVDREARDVATAQDIEELEGLSKLRRQFEAPRSGEEVLREYEQHQLIRNLLQSLTRYVEFARGAPAEPSSTRPRAKAKA